MAKGPSLLSAVPVVIEGNYWGYPALSGDKTGTRRTWSFLTLQGCVLLPSSIHNLQKWGFSPSPLSCTKPLGIVFSKVKFFGITEGYSKLLQEKELQIIS